LSLEYNIDMGTYAFYGILVLCICFKQTFGKW
jgi:cbb3-type cytochrome oxidase subunit 3